MAGLPDNDRDEIAQIFVTNDIGGDVLRELDESRLEKLGIKSLGVQLRILKAIKALLENGKPTKPLIAIYPLHKESANMELENALTGGSHAVVSKTTSAPAVPRQTDDRHLLADFEPILQDGRVPPAARAVRYKVMRWHSPHFFHTSQFEFASGKIPCASKRILAHRLIDKELRLQPSGGGIKQR